MKKLRLMIFQILLFFIVLMPIHAAGEEDIDQLIDKARGIHAVYFEEDVTITTEADGQNSAQVSQNKIWIKDGYFKKEAHLNGIDMIYIISPEGSYIYDSDSGRYHQTDDGQSSASVKLSSALFMGDFRNKPYKVLGVDRIEGKEVTLISTETETKQGLVLETFWIWNEKGMPVRYRQQLQLENSTMTEIHEFKNIRFEPIPESLFQLPSEE